MIDRVVEMEPVQCLRWDRPEFITICDEFAETPGPGLPLGLALRDLPGRFPPHLSRRKLREHPAQTCRKEHTWRVLYLWKR